MDTTLNGVRIAYHDRGRRHGTALLLIHGFPLDHRMWASQLVGLSADVRVIAPDLRGFGRSEVTPGPLTMEQHADDLAALLDHLAVERAVVAGLSMGGYIAFAFWRRHRRARAGARLARHARRAGCAAGEGQPRCGGGQGAAGRLGGHCRRDVAAAARAGQPLESADRRPGADHDGGTAGRRRRRRAGRACATGRTAAQRCRPSACRPWCWWASTMRSPRPPTRRRWPRRSQARAWSSCHVRDISARWRIRVR